MQDARAVSADAISSDLSSREITAGGPDNALVDLVLKRYRMCGAPWERCWDTASLHLLLLSAWAAEQSADTSAGASATRLVETFSMSNSSAAALAATTFAPVPSLSLQDTAKFPLTSALFAQHNESEASRGPASPETSHPCDERPDLLEFVSYTQFLRSIKDPSDDLRREVESLQSTLASDFLGLTDHEITLLRGDEEDQDYVNWCLTAGCRSIMFPLLDADSLPTSNDAGMQAPDWMQDQIIRGGARFIHTQIAPYAIWVATAESPEIVRIFEKLLLEGRVEIGHEEAEKIIRLHIRLDRDNENGPVSLPYTYDLSHSSGAWELLHLVECGTIRLTLLEMMSDEELTVIGTVSLHLQKSTTRDLASTAVAVLRSEIGNDAWRMSCAAAMLPGSSAEIEGAAFLQADLAKAEDILLGSGYLPGHNTTPWQEYRHAGTEAARRRASLATALLDGQDPDHLKKEVEAAEHAQEARLELARSTSTGDLNSGPEDLQSLASSLPDEHTAFIHLVVKDGYLLAVWLARKDFAPITALVDLSHINIAKYTSAALETTGLTHNPADSTESNRSSGFNMLSISLSEILTPIVESLLRWPIRRLIISPTRPFDRLPLHAAEVSIDGDHLLTELFDEVVYAPSLRLLRAIDLNTSEHLRLDTPLLVAHSGAGQASFDEISGPALELAVLKQLYPNARTLEEHDATPVATLQAAVNSPITHIASHAFTDKFRWAGGTVLEGPTLGSAALTSAQVLALGESRTSPLVVLTGCHTGTHLDDRPVLETMRSIDGAFLQQGSRAVVTSLWEVGDTTAAVFAAVFHAELDGGDTVGLAFAAATAYLRGQTVAHDSPSQARIVRVEGILDQERPNWRSELLEENASEICGWAAFKLSGVSWTSKRHPNEE